MLAAKLDHLHFRSSDPQRAADFYVEMFGAVPLAPAETANGLRCVVELAGLTMFIEQAPPNVSTAPEPPYLGLEHFGLAVADLEAYADELRRKGAIFSTEPKTVRPGLRMAFVRGPDGAMIELVERSSS